MTPRRETMLHMRDDETPFRMLAWLRDLDGRPGLH